MPQLLPLCALAGAPLASASLGVLPCGQRPPPQNASSDFGAAALGFLGWERRAAGVTLRRRKRQSLTETVFVQGDERLIWLEYAVVAFLAYASFSPIASAVARAPVRLPPGSIHHVLSSVMLPVTGFLFAVFTERAAVELKARIDLIETTLNREAGVLTLLVPQLSLLLVRDRASCRGAFSYLEQHVARLVQLLSRGSSWRRSLFAGVREDPADALWYAVVRAEARLLGWPLVSAVRVEVLRTVNDMLRELAQLRSVRIAAEESPLPPQLWLMLCTFAAVFSFSFMMSAADAVAPRTERPGLPRQALEEGLVEVLAASRRLRALWATLLVSIFAVLQMCADMRHPFVGQYCVDDHGVLAMVLRGPVSDKIRSALARC